MQNTTESLIRYLEPNKSLAKPGSWKVISRTRCEGRNSSNVNPLASLKLSDKFTGFKGKTLKVGSELVRLFFNFLWLFDYYRQGIKQNDKMSIMKIKFTYKV